MMQTGLFDNRQQIHANADPATSKLAGDALTASGARDNQKAAVLKALRDLKMDGVTSNELAHFSGLDRYVCARRLPDLERDGLVERLCAAQCHITGKWATQWTDK